jgi:surface protein
MIGSSKIGLRPIRGGGGGTPPNPDFVSTWDTTKGGSASDTIVFSLIPAGNYSGTIDWGDGNTSVLSYANRTHIYSAPGIYTITLTGTIEGFFAQSGDGRFKLIGISNWGTFTFLGSNSFYRSENLICTATDTPNVSTSNLSGTFRDCTLFNGTLNDLDLVGVTIMTRFFADADNFNQPLDNWDTSTVLDMDLLLYNCDSFDQDISSWQISQVTNLTNFMAISTGLSTANYDALLIAWDAQGAMAYSGTVNFGGSKYTSGGAADAARTSLISKWGGITDGGAA